MNKKTTDDLLYDIMVDLSVREPTPPDRLKRKVMILSTPRSGSSLFCDVINHSHTIGECREWFNMRYLQAYAKLKNSSNVSLTEYLDFIITRTLAGSDTFAVNMHIDQYRTLLKQNFDPFTLGFSETFYLQRNNKLRQAVSLAKAWQTDQWTANAKASNPAKTPPTNAMISQALSTLLNDEQFYRDNLQVKVSHEFSYETFRNLNDPDGIRRFFEILGLQADSNATTEMKIQSDESSEVLSDQFIAHISGRVDEQG